MSRTQDQTLAEIVTLLPTGPGWPVGASSDFAKIFAGLAGSMSGFEASAEALLSEVDPRTANYLLADFERCLGPDPCGRDAGALTPEQRGLLAYQRWTAGGGQSIGFFTALAASLGIPITITEIRRNCLGRLRCGMPLSNHPQQFTWIIALPQTTVRMFRTGASRCGEALGAIDRSSLIECVMQRFKPAQTVVVFSYTGVS